jgi:hypothetical protein
MYIPEYMPAEAKDVSHVREVSIINDFVSVAEIQGSLQGFCIL